MHSIACRIVLACTSEPFQLRHVTNVSCVPASQVIDMYDSLPNKKVNEQLVRMSVWVTDEDASDYLAVFASNDVKRSELLGMSAGKATKYDVVMSGTCLACHGVCLACHGV